MVLSKDNIVGEALVRLRKAANHKNQSKIAELCGVVINTVSSYERGERLPELDFIMKFSMACDLSEQDLFELIKLRLIACKAFGDTLDENSYMVDKILSNASTTALAIPNGDLHEKFGQAQNQSASDMQSRYVAKMISMNSLLVKVEGMKVANTFSTMSGRMPMHTKSQFDAVAAMIDKLNLED